MDFYRFSVYSCGFFQFNQYSYFFDFETTAKFSSHFSLSKGVNDAKNAGGQAGITDIPNRILLFI